MSGTTFTSVTVNRARHALAVTVGWGRPDTDPAGLGLPLAVAQELHGTQEVRAPEVATSTRVRPAAARTARARVRG
ncbi:hypothetical protein ACFWZ2_18715 [Streptomyces sp. NPDC059002]|uniref:hypothetical protein n=1 Tax=Streptomyces sp. NPDC059002 TaxID=3346690 RepID=UPI0036B8E013